VVIGICFAEPKTCEVFDYQHVASEPERIETRRLNGYLVDASHILIPARTPPPDGVPPLFKGSQPTDGARIKKPGGGYITRSNLILDAEQRTAFLAEAPEAEKWLRPYVGGDELISGDWRWCLWLKNANPKEIRACRPVVERLDRVKEGRLLSPTRSVREFAKFPTLFTQDRQPERNYIGIPEVSSETREYIPIGFLSPDVIASNKLQIIPNGDISLFALITSAMHMAWVRTIGGRLKSDYSYSPTVYNSFPRPDVNNKAEQALAKTGQAILDARANHPGTTLEDLYDPDSMPPDLRRAHLQNDRAVDRLYRRRLFESERERVENLFVLYEQRSAPLMAHSATKKRKPPTNKKPDK
jgi:hypothetical protein